MCGKRRRKSFCVTACLPLLLTFSSSALPLPPKSVPKKEHKNRDLEYLRFSEDLFVFVGTEKSTLKYNIEYNLFANKVQF